MSKSSLFALIVLISLKSIKTGWFRDKIKIRKVMNESLIQGDKRDICHRHPPPNCGTGKCKISSSEKGFVCVCPKAHWQRNETTPCEGIYIGLFGIHKKCSDGITSEEVTAINSRTLHIKDLHCEHRHINCQDLFKNAYFIAQMGTRNVRLKTVHFDKCTGTALPGLFPTDLYLEFPEDWYADSLYSLSIHDLHYETVLCQIDTTRKMRDQIALLDHPEETKCHYQNARISIGSIGDEEPCQGHLVSGDIEAVTSRIFKINHFHCDGDREKCHELLEAAFFVGRRGKNSVFMHTIVHDSCGGHSLPQGQYSFTMFLELPDHWTVDSLSSFLLWDYNTKKVLCRIKVDESMRRLMKFLPQQKKSRCTWDHEELHNYLHEDL